jgi:AraC family transcriptional regulator, transcriptional activator of the genes for pyochelin and ferripyochelin receptors
MCFEKTVMTSREFGLINHHLVSEPVREGMQMWQAIGTMGEILLSENQSEEFCVWHIEYNILEDVTLTLQQEPPSASIGLSFSLKKNIPYLIKNLRSGVAKRNHYNLTFLPESHCELSLRKGEYESFGVEFKPEFLRKLGGDNAPLFLEFVLSVLEGRPSSITDAHHVATSQIMDIVDELVHFRYPGVMPRLYIKSKVVDLLRLSIENIHTANKDTVIKGVSSSDLKALTGVREYILTNLGNPGTLPEIAIRTGMNEFKLKTGFKKAFGKSVIAFVHEQRLLRAKALITETELPMKVIAVKAGYRNLSNFTTAFRKLFGYPPGTLKRGSSQAPPLP